MVKGMPLSQRLMRLWRRRHKGTKKCFELERLLEFFLVSLCFSGFLSNLKQFGPRLNCLLHNLFDALAFITGKWEARRAHMLGTNSCNRFGKLDVLHELGRYVKVKQRHEPAI